MTNLNDRQIEALLTLLTDTAIDRDYHKASASRSDEQLWELKKQLREKEKELEQLASQLTQAEAKIASMEQDYDDLAEVHRELKISLGQDKTIQ